ncbi:xylulokinase [Leeia oryzae]|uniref:xylulokinase n=1 Tax=Leeia oryzae TaxID=356662 RepID=UPI000366EE5A|nr:xylulokinase [Leeia oryzae]
MYLGIDLGTSEVKVVLLDATHQLVATHGVPLSISRPQPLWSEQQPEDWWAALLQACDALARDYPSDMQQVRAIGLSGQMHGAVLLDHRHQVLRPAILWNDGRCGEECRLLEDKVPELRHITGNMAMPGFTAPKLLWVQRHEPDIFRQISKVLLPKDYLRLQLTGEMVSDCSDASGTLWLDVARRTWSDVMLAACGLTEAHMPKLVEGSEPSGMLAAGLKARWGMIGEVVVAGGGGDNAASAVGMGGVEPGQGFVSLGTSGVIFVASDQFRPNPDSAMHAFCHALPGRWHQMSVMLSAASCLRWVTRLTGYANEATLLADVEQLDATDRARAPLFLPYLSGERTPHNNPDAQGVFMGLTHDHGAAHLAYAVIEGVSFGLKDGLATLQETGQPVSELMLVGGGARSPYWAQLLADTLNVRMVVTEASAAGGALGAARLGWLADGGVVSQVCRPLATTGVFVPDADARTQLLTRYQRFQRLYDHLADLF